MSSWNEEDKEYTQIGTNSYDVTLHPFLVEYTGRVLDPRVDNKFRVIKMSESGFVLKPGRFVLGATEEMVRNNSQSLVPMLEGRSSIARLGLQVHMTAGFGDIGFGRNGARWTLELSAMKAIRLYPLMPIAQLYWITTQRSSKLYSGKYQDGFTPQASQMWKEYEKRNS